MQKIAIFFGLLPLAFTGQAQSVYNTDGTVAGDRIISQAGRYLRFQQSGSNYTQFNGALQTIQTDGASAPFYVRVIKSPYAGAPADGMLEWRESLGFGNQTPGLPNYPYMRGWNLAGGGSNYIAGLPALGESWEPHYLPDGSSPTLWLMEYHKYYIQPGGQQRRLESWTVDTRSSNWNVYYTVPRWSLRDTFNVDYLSANTASGTDKTSLLQLMSGNGLTNTQFLSAGTANLMQIRSASGGKLQFTNWADIDLGNGNGYNPVLNMWGISSIAQGFTIYRASQPWGIRFKNSAGGNDVGAITYDANTGECRDFVAAGGYYKTLYTNGSELMRLSTRNNVLIGTATDNTVGKLQVNGKVTIEAIDSSGSPANMLWIDPNTNEIKKAAVSNAGSLGYQVYTALLSQSGTSHPTANILGTNTIGSIIWIRNSTGNYTGTLPGAFTANKTWLFVQRGDEGGNTLNNGISRTSANTVLLTVLDNNGSATDNFNNMSVEIRVYPNSEPNSTPTFTLTNF